MTSRTVPILTYHSIDESGSPISVSPERFRAQMAGLRAAGWRSLGPQEFLLGHAAGVWPAHTFVLTFDDGFENFRSHAAPTLAALGFTAVLFVVAGHVGGANDWLGQPAWVPRQRLLDWSALRELIPTGVTLGAHSWSHRRLARLSPDDALSEMLRSKRTIEDRTGAAVDWFAYPYGETSRALERTAASQFTAAVGTKLALATAGDRLTALRRVDVYYLGQPWWFSRLDAAWLRSYLGVRRALRAARGVLEP